MKHLKALNQLQLKESRIKYFQCVDFLRTQGQDTTDGLTFISKGDSLLPATTDISWLLQTSTQYLGFESHSRRFVSALLAYLNNALVTGADDEGKVVLPDGSDPPTREKSRCLISKRLFNCPSALMKHSKATHTKETACSKLFLCPECQVVVSGSGQWSHHVERVHGKRMRRIGIPK